MKRRNSSETGCLEDSGLMALFSAAPRNTDNEEDNSGVLSLRTVPIYFYLVFATPKYFDIYRIHKCVSL